MSRFAERTGSEKPRSHPSYAVVLSDKVRSNGATVTSPNRLVVLSNRLPITLGQRGHGVELQESTGGLVAAFGPILRRWGGLWIGWPGAEDLPNLPELLATHAADAGYSLEPVFLTKMEQERFYIGFSNEVIWPLFHDLQNFCNFKPDYWDTYQEVNRKYAASAARANKPGDYLWVQDYHLMHVAKELRALGVESKIGFFLHIPFPPPDIFLKLPWRRQLLEALLAYDLVGFQTPRDQLNFLNCFQVLFPDASVQSVGQLQEIETSRGSLRLGSFPIGIEAAALQQRSMKAEVAKRADDIRARLPNRQFVLGVDRLDYTKGIPSKLRAFRRALERFPDLHQRVSLIQILSPSREGIPRYNDLKSEVERLVGRINGQFTESGWVPIHYIYRNLDHEDVLAWYRAADVALVTPLKDGMNLVAKEYVACKHQGPGVLILSEFAGASTQLRTGALLVNPYNLEEVAEAIHHALTMPAPKRVERMRNLQENVFKEDIFWWVDSFLQAAGVGLQSTSERASTPARRGKEKPRAPRVTSARER